MAGTSFAYALEYFRGVREGASSREQAFRELADFAERFERKPETIASPTAPAIAP